MNSNDDMCKLNSCLFFTTTKLTRVLKKNADDIFNITGLSPSHAFILYMVALKKKIHQKEVGEYLHLTPSTISRFVAKLESKKLIEKEVEGKNVYLIITEKGQMLQTTIMQSWETLNSLLNSTLTDDEKLEFIKLSNKILTNLDE